MRWPRRSVRASVPAPTPLRWKPRRRRCADEMDGLEKRVPLTSDAAIRRILEGLPNVLDASVPDGPDETANLVLAQHGEPASAGNFAPKQHFDLGEALGMMDFATAAKLAGARFTILRGPLARMERALGQFMLDLHTQRAWLYRDHRPVAGQRGHRLRDRQFAEVRGGPLQDHRRPLSDPDRRGAADQHRRRRDPGGESSCRSA